MLTLADSIEAICGMRPDWARWPIQAAYIDSRQVTPHSIFFALPGENNDGHDFVAHAFKMGADFAIIQKDIPSHLLSDSGFEFPVIDLRKHCVVEDIALVKPPLCIRVENCLEALQEIARFWRRKVNLRVIGITGSVGKSTTKELAANVLSMRYRTLKNAGNLNNEIGLPLTLLGLDKKHECAVLEMGFYVPGEISFLCEIAQPQVGVITNIGTVHAERAGSQAAIALGKSELVQALPPAPVGTAILNYDDPWVRDMSGKTQATVFFYGMDDHADLWADRVDGLGLDGIRFRLHYRRETMYLRVPLIGRHSVHTALRAAAVGLVEGLAWEEIIEGLHLPQTQLRLVSVRARNGALILDDTYNASPESTLAALNLLDEMQGQKIAVLGDMLELGPYEKVGHEMVGARAAEVVDELVVLGERARMIASAAQSAGLATRKITILDSVQEVIDCLRDRLQADHVVLVKGSHSLRMDRIVAALETRQ